VSCQRQGRWRPAWFIEIEREGHSAGGAEAAGERLAIYFRGDRGISDHGAYALEHEMKILQVLEREGIPVPHVYGFCDEPRGIVMERVPGRADLGTAIDEAERMAVQDDYMRILARVHDLDIAPFEAVGLERPRDTERIALSDFPIWEQGYRKSKSRPEPLIEFAVAWLLRNVPESSGRLSFVCADSGQFLFEAGRVTALLDLELAHLGDPAEDLAGLRGRDLSEPLGDLRRAVTTYESITGRPVDRRLIDYHTVRFTLITPMAVARLVAAPAQGIDLVQYLCWYHVFGRAPIEVIAHMQGVPLEPPALPDPEPTRHASAHDFLAEALAPDAGADAFDTYAGDAAYRVAEYLRRSNLYGPALEADDLDDAARLLGSRPPDWSQADTLLEQAILESGPERDAEWLWYLQRRSLRQEALLETVMRELQQSRIQMLD